jgi:MFS transporter, DHA1 family, tetracycline resistance protein
MEVKQLAVEQPQGIMPFFRELRKNRNAFSMLLYEPMWGIPYNLFIPYFSLYMTDLGCSPEQIGLINTVGMAFQVVFALLAAPITDRLGRRKTTLVFDLISWSGAALIWMFAGNFWWFLAAALVQSVNRIVGISWTCLLVEDTDKSLLVNIFSWLTIAGLLAGVFSPVAAVFVQKYTVVPTIRVLLGIAFVMMTVMFLLRNITSKETSVGLARMRQSKSEPFLSLSSLFSMFRGVWRRKRTVFFFVLSAAYYAALAVKAPFFALLLTKTLQFSDAAAGFFAAISSFVMLVIYLFAQPVLRRFLPKAPLTVGLALCTAGSLALLLNLGSWWANLAVVVLSVVLTSIGTAVAQPFIDGLSHASMDNDKRSEMTSVLNIAIMLTSAPFGFIGGWLYTWNSRAPFFAASLMFVACAALMVIVFKNEGEKEAAAA